VKGIIDLLDLAKTLGIEKPIIHFVAVVPEGATVEFSLTVTAEFPITMFSLEVTDSELYP
jgi:hypothetical protein